MPVEVIQPFRVFPDVDGEPLEDGYIHIGAVNQNPQAVPISVFWDEALTIPAAQPIRTLGGYPSRSGTPARMYVAESEYSISVSNKNSTLIYSDLNNRAGIPVRFSEFPFVTDFGANGDGVADNVTPFTDAAANSKLTFIPKPAVKYLFSAPVGPSAGTWLPDPGQTWDQLTDGGDLDLHRGHFSSSPNGANMWRLSDRLFVGEAASNWAAASGGVPDAGSSWLSDDANGPAFLGVNATLLVTTEENTESGARYAIVGAAKTSALTNNGGIGVAGAVINQKAGSPGWAFYADVQAEISDNYTYGMELAIKNASGVNATLTPYSAPTATIGIWLAAGGDSAYGPAPTDPSGAGIVIGDNDSTWNTGLLFLADGLTGTDGTSGSATFATAIGMGRNQEVTWFEPTNGGYGAKARSRVTAAASRVMLDFLDNQVVLRGANETPIFSAQFTAGNANYLGVLGAAATAAPRLTASGTDTNIDIWLSTKGTGLVRFGTFVGSGDVAIIGSMSIKDDGGTIRKVAVVA